jgi:selenocysteine lyase/cysteine desulfurase
VGHVSNVTGTAEPISAIGSLCRRKGIPFLVDAAQSAGSVPLDVKADNIDLLAFPGHKGLFGPEGTGGLYIRPGLKLATIREGGTGSRSELKNQPDDIPSRYESGTANVPGIAALGEGIRFVMDTGIEKIRKHEAALASRLLEGLSAIQNVTIYGPPPGPERNPVISITIKGIDPASAAMILDQSFGIAVRSGLHCAPCAHELLGTLKSGGTIRLSPGYFNTEAEIDACIKAVGEIAHEV